MDGWLDGCPGLWYGNNPSGEQLWGNCVVATDKVCAALTWLKRRRASITATSPGPHYSPMAADHGVCLHFALPAKKVGA